MPNLAIKLEHLQSFMGECDAFYGDCNHQYSEILDWVVCNAGLCRDSDVLWDYGSNLRGSALRYLDYLVTNGHPLYCDYTEARSRIDFMISEFYEVSAEIITQLIRNGCVRNDGFVLVTYINANGDYLFVNYDSKVNLTGLITKL